MKRITQFFGIILILSSCANHMVKTETGLEYVILKKGKGQPVKAGDEILFYETTSYRNGTVLFSNENSGKPIQVLVGGNQVTAAVDEGLRGMKTGEVRKIVAPPYLVKREVYPSFLSPDSTLVIKMELIRILEKE